MEQLLSTKFFVPPTRLKFVSRPRLVERINAGLHSNLTLISTPAGFGKTTLVSEWIGQSRSDGQNAFRIAWLSLDESDNDPVRFFSYLIAAIRRAEGVETTVAKGVVDMLQSSQAPPIKSILTTMINDISALSGKIILILDDYHLISDPAIDDALTFLLENLPPQLHLVISTRVDPQMPLAKLRASGRLNELRAADLRFSTSETTEFLNEAMGLALSPQDITSLKSRTEGWIAGLQLAAISLQGRDDTASFIKSFTGSHRLILDYLIAEVLNQQSENFQNFLLQTAILDKLTGPLCNAVTGEEDSQAILEMFEEINLFITPLDEERRWYRYHHLFADLLRQRLKQTQPETMPILHSRAAEWFYDQGMSREAIKHSLAAKDYQGAVKLIETIAIDTIQLGEHSTVTAWIDAIPDENVKEKPYLCVLHAWTLQLSGKLDISESRLTDAENALDNLKKEEQENTDTVRGLIHSRRAYKSFMVGEFEKTIYHAQRALEQLPEDAALLRIRIALYLGVAYRYQGQLTESLHIYEELLPLAKTMGGKSIAVLYFIHLGDIYRKMAQLHQAKKAYEQALIITQRHTGRSDLPYLGFVYVRIGQILRHWNQLEDAYHFTTKGMPLSRDWKVADILGLSCIDLAYICQAMGNYDEARASIQEAGKIMDSISPWASKYASAHQARIDISLGDIEAAERWAQTNDLDLAGDFEFHREIEYLALARVLIAQKQYEKASSLVERINRLAQENGIRLTELDTLILLSLIFSEKGDKDQALVHLEKALSIGKPEGFIRIFLDEGLPMAKLLYQALDRGISPDYVSRLLSEFAEIRLDQPNPEKIQDPNSQLIEPLSEREIEVLHLLANGLTNKEIASKLYLSMNTIKVHTRNIYGKLTVSNRTQAVARAKSLGIIPSE